MSFDRQLLALEEQFWKGDADFYRRNLTEQALMVFAEPVGVLDKARTLQTIAAAPRWTEVNFENVYTVRLGAQGALLTYRVTARRAGDETPYTALASSVYIEADGGWKLALHQQTPGSPR